MAPLTEGWHSSRGRAQQINSEKLKLFYLSSKKSYFTKKTKDYTGGLNFCHLPLTDLKKK